jgi:hypothetical protein
MMIVGKSISWRSQILHIFNTESGCLSDRFIIQAIEQLPRDRLTSCLNSVDILNQPKKTALSNFAKT